MRLFEKKMNVLRIAIMDRDLFEMLQICAIRMHMVDILYKIDLECTVNVQK